MSETWAWIIFGYISVEVNFSSLLWCYPKAIKRYINHYLGRQQISCCNSLGLTQGWIGNATTQLCRKFSLIFCILELRFSLHSSSSLLCISAHTIKHYKSNCCCLWYLESAAWKENVDVISLLSISERFAFDIGWRVYEISLFLGLRKIRFWQPKG